MARSTPYFIITVVSPRNGIVTTTEDLSDSAFGISKEAAIIFMWVIYCGVCQLLDILGVVTNITNIICFVIQGFKDSVNVCLLGLSISDLGCLITLVCSNILVSLALQAADIPFEPLKISYLVTATPHFAFSRVSSWITVIITLERCLCVIAPLKVKTVVTPKRTLLIVVCIYIITFGSVSPTHVVNSLDTVHDLRRNKTILTLVSTKDRELVDLIALTINSVLIPLTAFIVIVICTVILAVKLLSAEKWRIKSTTHAHGVSIRNHKIAKMVLMVSTMFIVCNFPICSVVLVMAFEPGLFFEGRYINLGLILGGICFVFESVNYSANIFIYYNMSSKYIDTCKSILCKKQKETVFIDGSVLSQQ